jgi:RNA polymerase sigma-70 factor (ECF subfamily)
VNGPGPPQTSRWADATTLKVIHRLPYSVLPGESMMQSRPASKRFVTSQTPERLNRHGPARPDIKATVESAKSGDATAWEQLYLAIYPRLSSFARCHLDDDRASEAVSETFARAVAGISRFSSKGGGFEGWIFAILRHVITDAHRRHGRAQRHVPLFDGERNQPEIADGLLADEEVDAVRAAYRKLRPVDQELLHLRVVSGLSADDVAKVLGKRAGAVRMAQARALEHLRGALNNGSQP